MTTRVLVNNLGPDNVTVAQKYVENGEQSNPLILIKPNEFKEIYVHKNQFLEVREV